MSCCLRIGKVFFPKVIVQFSGNYNAAMELDDGKQ